MNDMKQDFHAIDVHVGARVRALRIQQHLTQSQLAKRLGISFQQMQKYETGANRISASKLYGIAKVLDCAPSYFFEGLELDADERHIALDLEAARLAADIANIESPSARKMLRDLAATLSKLNESAFERATKISELKDKSTLAEIDGLIVR